MTGFWWVHTSGQRNQETVKFLSGPCTAEWAIDCFLYSPPSFFLNTAINFLSCLTNSFFLPSLPLALFVAEEDAQSIGGILQTSQPLQPGWTEPEPGSFSPERPENQNSPGIRAHTCKNRRGWGGFRRWIPSINFYAWRRFSSKRRRVPFIPQWLRITLGIVWASPGQPAALRLLCQARAARQTSARRPASVTARTFTHQMADAMDGASAWAPMQQPGLRLVGEPCLSPDDSVCTQHIVLGHITLASESASCRAGTPATFTSCYEYITAHAHAR